jgi:hypothetical protein
LPRQIAAELFAAAVHQRHLVILGHRRYLARQIVSRIVGVEQSPAEFDQ